MDFTALYCQSLITNPWTTTVKVKISVTACLFLLHRSVLRPLSPESSPWDTVLQQINSRCSNVFFDSRLIFVIICHFPARCWILSSVWCMEWVILGEELQVDHSRTDVCDPVRKKPVCYIVIVTNILSGQVKFLKSPCWCMMYLCKKRTLLSLWCWLFLNVMQLWWLSSFYGRQIIVKRAKWGFRRNVARQMAAKVSVELNYRNYAMPDFSLSLMAYNILVCLLNSTTF